MEVQTAWLYLDNWCPCEASLFTAHTTLILLKCTYSGNCISCQLYTIQKYLLIMLMNPDWLHMCYQANYC
jgi:hypothetical protein